MGNPTTVRHGVLHPKTKLQVFGSSRLWSIRGDVTEPCNIGPHYVHQLLIPSVFAVDSDPGESDANVVLMNANGG